MYIYIHIYTDIQTYMPTYLHTYIHVYVCIFIYIYTYIFLYLLHMSGIQGKERGAPEAAGGQGNRSAFRREEGVVWLASSHPYVGKMMIYGSDRDVVNLARDPNSEHFASDIFIRSLGVSSFRGFGFQCTWASGFGELAITSAKCNAG